MFVKGKNAYLSKMGDFSILNKLILKKKEIEEDWVEMGVDSKVLRGRNCLKTWYATVSDSFLKWESVQTLCVMVMLAMPSQWQILVPNFPAVWMDAY